MVTHPEIQLRNFVECNPRIGGGIVVLNNEYAICIKNKFLSISFHLIKLDKIKVNLLNVNQTKPQGTLAVHNHVLHFWVKIKFTHLLHIQIYTKFTRRSKLKYIFKLFS